MKRTVNLGCGESPLEGAVNVDLYSSSADVRHDLNTRPYPFPDDSFDVVHAMNVIEHLHDVIGAMEEIHRISARGGIVHIRVPHFRSACLYEDLTHVKGFAWRSFDIFTEASTVYGHYTKARYEILSRKYTPYIFAPLYSVLSAMPVLTDNLLSKYIPMASILFEMKVVKD